MPMPELGIVPRRSLLLVTGASTCPTAARWSTVTTP